MSLVEAGQKRSQVLRKIEAVIQNLVELLCEGQSPAVLVTDRRKWENIGFDASQGLHVIEDPTLVTVSFDSIASVKRIAIYLKIMSTIYDNVQSNSFCTKRDLYYRDPALYGSQEFLDTIIEEVASLIGVPRWNLHLFATSKGLIAGALFFTDVDGSYIDCTVHSTTIHLIYIYLEQKVKVIFDDVNAISKTGSLVPSCIQGITNMSTTAKFVLVVEKDASFQHLLLHGILQKLGPCILVTGKGFPDVNTRMLLKLLWNKFKLPTYALVDADPHGMEIMAVYKFGSKAMCSYGDILTVPSLKWLGVLPSDISRMRIDPSGLLHMTTRDIAKAKKLLKRSYLESQPSWKSEIEIMLESGLKAEIQCLYSIHSSFLLDVYIPKVAGDVKRHYEAWHSGEMTSDSMNAYADRKRLAATQLQRSLGRMQEIGDQKLALVAEVIERIESKTRQLEQNVENIANVGMLKEEDVNSTLPAASQTRQVVQTAQSTNIANAAEPTNLIASPAPYKVLKIEEKVDLASTIKTGKRLKRHRTVQESVPLEKEDKKADEDEKLSLRKKKVKREKTDNILPVNHKLNVDPNEPTYCLCQQISYGEMIGCDNEQCPIEWFHFDCVRLTHKPKGKWYCPRCRGARPNIINPDLFLEQQKRSDKVASLSK